jgi:hypothetical protein
MLLLVFNLETLGREAPKRAGSKQPGGGAANRALSCAPSEAIENEEIELLVRKRPARVRTQWATQMPFHG